MGKLNYFMKGQPKYCKKCGAKLLATSKVEKHDGKTGQPTRFIHTISCPEFRWMLFPRGVVVGNGHARFTWARKTREF